MCWTFVESQSTQFQPGDRVIAISENNQALAENFVAQAIKAVRLPLDLASSDTICLVQPLSTVMNALTGWEISMDGQLQWLDWGQPGYSSADCCISGVRSISAA
jgi:NADPH:quinone reductase-like Zn-dependent oxidoreductase